MTTVYRTPTGEIVFRFTMKEYRALAALVTQGALILDRRNDALAVFGDGVGLVTAQRVIKAVQTRESK